MSSKTRTMVIWAIAAVVVAGLIVISGPARAEFNQKADHSGCVLLDSC